MGRANGRVVRACRAASKQRSCFASHVAVSPPPRPNSPKAVSECVARGKKKADETLCTMCHLGGLIGRNEIPRAAGQHDDYTVKQLRDFKTGKRTNDAGNMASVSKTLSEQDVADLGHCLASLF
jgi:cytochrome c553